MDPLDIFNHDNPKMSLIWKAASGLMGLITPGIRRDIVDVNINEICDHLRIVIGNPDTRVNTKTYFNSSMVMSGALRLHVLQARFLLDDVTKLLDTMRRERKIMKDFDKTLDCSTRGKKQINFDPLDLDAEGVEIDLAGSPRGRTLTTVDFGTLDGGIDWEQGPPRAHPEDITLRDQDVAASPRLMAEMERMRALEENLEGSILLDWGDIQMETSHEGEKAAVEMQAEPPSDILVPEEAQVSVPRIEIEEPPKEDATPPVPADAAAAAQTTPEPPAREEQPSQMELEVLEDVTHRGGRRQVRRKVPRLIIDQNTIFDKEEMRDNIRDYTNTMRVTEPRDDVTEVSEQLLTDFFAPKPPHRKNMTDYLVRFFRPCEEEAPLPGSAASPTHHPNSSEDIVRGASYLEERDLSNLPSLLQDISSESTKSKSVIYEVPSAVPEKPPVNLQTIEDQDGVVASPGPLMTEDSETKKRKRGDKKRGEKSDGSSASSPPHGKRVRLSEEAGEAEGTGEEQQQQEERVDTLPVELSQSSSESPDEGFTKVQEMTSMVLDYFAHHSEAFMEDLLPPGASMRRVCRLFVILLYLFQAFKLDLHQKEVFGPIRITPHLQPHTPSPSSH